MNEVFKFRETKLAQYEIQGDLKDDFEFCPWTASSKQGNLHFKISLDYNIKSLILIAFVALQRYSRDIPPISLHYFTKWHKIHWGARILA